MDSETHGGRMTGIENEFPPDFSPEFSSDWFSVNIENWTRFLGPFRGRPDLRFLEIGCFEGRASVWLLGHILTHTTSMLTCIDPFNPQEMYENLGFDISQVQLRFERNVRPFKDRVRLIREESGIALRQSEIFKNESMDFVYIDGSHDAKNVLEDAVLSWRLLKSGGILIFDDYGLTMNPHILKRPRIAIDSFLYIYDGEFDVLFSDYQFGVQKKIR